MCPNPIDGLPAAGNADVAANPETLVTVIRSVDPSVIGKTFDYDAGQLKALRRSSNIKRGIASSELITDTAERFAELLRQITEETNSVLVPGLFNGDAEGYPFNIVTEGELSDLTGLPVGSPDFANIMTARGERYAARLKRCIAPSCWMLFDFDRGVAGMPDAWRNLPIGEALAMYEPLLPGITSAERITYRSSSARIIGPGREAGLPSHAWVRVDEPAKIETAMRHLQVHAVLNNLAFRSPRYSQTTGEVIGEQWRGLFDWSVLITGRLVFTSKPILTDAAQAAGFEVMPAGVDRSGDGVLSLVGIGMPTQQQFQDYQRATGVSMSLRTGSDGSSMSVHVSGNLNYETPILSRGAEQTFGAWLETMRPGDTLRCEAPFRESSSEAAFIRCTGTGQGFVYDIGVGETYTLDRVEVDRAAAQDAAALGQDLLRNVVGERAAALINEQAREHIAEDDGRALIVVDKERPDRTAAQILPHLARIKHRPMWSVGDYMIFVDGAHRVDTRREDDERFVPVIGTKRVNAVHLLGMLPEVVSLKQPRASRLVPVKPSQDVLNLLLNMPEVKDHLPLLRAISNTPFMRPDGTICSTPGYDAATETWLHTALAVDVSDRPTRDDAMAALALLRGLLDEMHFRDVPDDGSVGSDEAVALAAMMGVVLRPAFEACPALIINGTAAGAGKSYFTKLLSVLSTGRDPAMFTWPQRREELDKLLDSLLYDGVSIIVFDNANGVKLTGHKLCSLVSESEIAGRLLGSTATIKLSTRGASLIINGNRVEAKEDFAQRAMSLQLAPNVVIARAHRFERDPLAAVRANRARYVQAVLTIARSFRVCDAGRLPPWQGFAEWSNTVRSALVWLGCPDPLGSTVAAVEDDDELQGVQMLVGAAQAFRPDGSAWKVADFMAWLTSQPQMLADLREALDPDDAHGLTRFGSLVGYWLQHKVHGRSVDLPGGRLASVERGRRSGGRTRWRVCLIE